MNYKEEKEKYAYELYKKGKPFYKVYAVIEKDGKFVVLHNLTRKGASKYRLSGGGVDEGEDNITAIKRELKEELNFEVEIVKSLGVISYPFKRKYKDIEYTMQYVAEIFYTRFIKLSDNSKFGIAGEFNGETEIVSITKNTMLRNVKEFTEYGVTLK